MIVTWSDQTSTIPALKPGKPKKTKPSKQGAVDALADEESDQPKTALEIAREVGLSDDDRRPDNQLTVGLFGKPLIIGGQIEGDVRDRGHYNLGRNRQSDQLDATGQAKLEAIWLPSDTLIGFASGRAVGNFAIQSPGGTSDSTAGVALDGFWFLKTRVLGTPFAIQAGRQRLQDRRKFWWDDDLNMVRVHYFGSKLTAYAGVGTNAVNLSTLNTISPEERRRVRYLGNASWEWSKRNFFEAFALHQDNRAARFDVGDILRRDRSDDKDAKLTWIGARARGCVKTDVFRRICYWGDLAQVRGTEVRYDLTRLNTASVTVGKVNVRSVHGSAYDVGVSVELPFKFKPFLTVGLARGSGDPPATPGSDGAFRQSGLQANNGKFRGLTRFRYYGEVLRPNLSNIRISTAALGVPVGKTSWAEFIWHNYRQPFADTRISGSRLAIDPNGISRELGNEFDVVLSHRPSAIWEFELTAGGFRANSAFGAQDGKWAGLVELKIDRNF